MKELHLANGTWCVWPPEARCPLARDVWQVKQTLSDPRLLLVEDAEAADVQWTTTHPLTRAGGAAGFRRRHPGQVRPSLHRLTPDSFALVCVEPGCLRVCPVRGLLPEREVPDVQGPAHRDMCTQATRPSPAPQVAHTPVGHT